jgi:hypothetical protein
MGISSHQQPRSLACRTGDRMTTTTLMRTFHAEQDVSSATRSGDLFCLGEAELGLGNDFGHLKIGEIDAVSMASVA